MKLSAVELGQTHKDSFDFSKLSTAFELLFGLINSFVLRSWTLTGHFQLVDQMTDPRFLGILDYKSSCVGKLLCVEVTELLYRNEMVSNTNSNTTVLGLDSELEKVGWGKCVIKPASAKILCSILAGVESGLLQAEELHDGYEAIEKLDSVTGELMAPKKQSFGKFAHNFSD